MSKYTLQRTYASEGMYGCWVRFGKLIFSNLSISAGYRSESRRHAARGSAAGGLQRRQGGIEPPGSARAEHRPSLVQRVCGHRMRYDAECRVCDGYAPVSSPGASWFSWSPHWSMPSITRVREWRTRTSTCIWRMATQCMPTQCTLASVPSLTPALEATPEVPARTVRTRVCPILLLVCHTGTCPPRGCFALVGRARSLSPWRGLPWLAKPEPHSKLRSCPGPATQSWCVRRTPRSRRTLRAREPPLSVT